MLNYGEGIFSSPDPNIVPSARALFPVRVHDAREECSKAQQGRNDGWEGGLGGGGGGSFMIRHCNLN